ncbi:MAG: ATP-dependent RecD-like DNA helicase, partial [Desulfobacteraceae bacterium]|nr:ATP-dependent RecD-like DNA helicase [Desulfobacteraceae bacterium]
HGNGNKPKDSVSVVGLLKDFQAGDVATFQGLWKSHPKYGKQFAAANAVIEVPREEGALRDYLDRSFSWIGPVLAGKLVEKFGDRLFDVMEKYPQELAAIPGITPKRAMEIHEEYLKVKCDREDDLWFSRHHITLNMRNRLVDVYGSKADVIKTIESNPYVLSDEVWGIGFKKADAIALSIGIARDSSVRAGACLRWVLHEAANEGHCFLPEPELIERCCSFLVCEQSLVERAVEDCLKSEKMIAVDADGTRQIYNAELYEAEMQIAVKLRVLAGSHHAQIMSDLTAEEIKELDPDQQKALELALSSKIMVITGGPGVGKTYVINRIIRALGDRTIELAAPTGKAAKRMSEMTGREARTIHRLLMYSPMDGGFLCNKYNPLDCETLIIDETSMIDVSLMCHLLEAITTKTQVIFVGDVDQLPSVGAGRVLADMIESSVIPVSRLQTLHRQAGESLININAQRINHGHRLELQSMRNDFWFVSEEDPNRIPGQIVQIIQKVPRNFYLEDGTLEMAREGDPIPDPNSIKLLSMNDIQVLCPQKRGPIGTDYLNEVLRPILNPIGKKLPGTQFISGDRVIQMTNDYKLEIFNGDIGIVEDSDEEYLFIQFDDLKGKKTVSYPRTETGSLKLAYALTIHKSQGSEFPVVVIPIHTTNYMMLRRNLIYTGITRGKKLVILVGSMKAVTLAIRTLDSTTRYSNLGKWLKG